jgi:hypothetical protein
MTEILRRSFARRYGALSPNRKWAVLALELLGATLIAAVVVDIAIHVGWDF